MKPLTTYLILGFLFFSPLLKSQSLSLVLKVSPSVNFDFATIADYINGITKMNVSTLNIEANSVDWDLYVGATTSTPGMWNVTSTYSIGGIAPPISIMQVRVRNASNTSQVGGFFNLQDISNPTYIIGSLASDATKACPVVGTNAAGSYLTSPNCYTFQVDLKLVPGLIYQSGLYTLRIDYVLFEDL